MACTKNDNEHAALVTVSCSLHVTCPLRFVPTAPPPPEDEGEGDDKEDLDEGGDDDEQLQKEAKAADSKKEEEEPPPVVGGDDEPGMWEETFKSHSDSKPYGVCCSQWSYPPSSPIAVS